MGIWGITLIARSIPGPTYSNPVGRTTAKVSASPIPRDQTVEVRGQVQCLPRKTGSGSANQACAIGLRTADGHYYSVTDPSQAIAQYHTGDEVYVTGTIDPAKATEVYDVTGIITATGLRSAN